MAYADKHWVHKYMQPVYLQFLLFISAPVTYLTRFATIATNKDVKLSPLEDLLPLVQLVIMFFVGSQNNVEISQVFWLWLFVHCFSAYWGFFTR